MHYDCIKFYFKILCIMSLAKITKTRSESMNSTDFFPQNLTNLSFLLSLHNKIFHIEKLHDRSVYSWIHTFFFWRFQFWNFWCLSYQAPGCPGAISIFRFSLVLLPLFVFAWEGWLWFVPFSSDGCGPGCGPFFLDETQYSTRVESHAVGRARD
jgi:hypothetical protein